MLKHVNFEIEGLDKGGPAGVTEIGLGQLDPYVLVLDVGFELTIGHKGPTAKIAAVRTLPFMDSLNSKKMDINQKFSYIENSTHPDRTFHNLKSSKPAQRHFGAA